MSSTATTTRPAWYLVMGRKETRADLDAYRSRCWKARRPTITVWRQERWTHAEVELWTPCMFDATAAAKLDVLLGYPLYVRPERVEGQNAGTSIHAGSRADVDPHALGRDLAAVAEDALPYLYWRADIGPGARWRDVDEREHREVDMNALLAFEEQHRPTKRRRWD